MQCHVDEHRLRRDDAFDRPGVRAIDARSDRIRIACIAGELGEDGIDIIGIGTAPSKGLRRGVVVNIDATVSSIQQAVDEAENWLREHPE